MEFGIKWENDECTCLYIRELMTLQVGEKCMCKYNSVITINAERCLWDIHTVQLLDATYGSLFQNEPKEKRNGGLC